MLAIDYQFTFNLSKKEDRFYTQINFKNTPPKTDLDVDFMIISSIEAKMNISYRTGKHFYYYMLCCVTFYSLVIWMRKFGIFFLESLMLLFQKPQKM